MDTLLEISGVNIRLPKNADREFAVQDVSFDLHAGEIVCVVGESGSGKSTIAHAVLGLLPKELSVSAGSISIRGANLLKLNERGLRKVRGKRIGMIFQEPLSALNPLMCCSDQIAEVLREHGQHTGARIHDRIKELLISVGLEDHRRIAASYPHQLSGGQRQRVMIAIALALEPEILIADEPTTALDVTTQAQIIQLILEIQQRSGLGVLFITHDFGVVSEIAHRIVVMKDGRIVESGAAKDILSAPAAAYTRALLEAVPSIVPPSYKTKPSGQPLLSVRGLSKTYKRRKKWTGGFDLFPALKGVSFDIHHGEVVGLVGESGSGKSTLGRIIAGLIDADEGKAALDGQDLLGVGAFHDKTLRHAVQMIFQDPYGSLNPRHSIKRILTGGMRLVGMSRQEAVRRAAELLETVRLDASALDRFPHEFSGGQRQRLGFARAIALSPRLIIADEPVSALDVSVQKQILDLLRALKDQLNLSILFITHDLRVAAQLCERIIVLEHGTAVEQGDTGTILSNPQHEYTQQLIAAVPGRDWK